MPLPPTIHASCVLLGTEGILIRGAAGSGKSRTVREILRLADNAGLFARLVADDRVYLKALNGRLLARAPENLVGLMEVRGLGIVRLPYEPEAVMRLVVDLEEAPRMPAPETMSAEIMGISLPRRIASDVEMAVDQIWTMCVYASNTKIES